MVEKIRQFLNDQYLAWVIIDSIPHTKLISLMSRLGIGYPGVRITSLPVQNLAYDLAGDALGNKEVMEALVKTLNELNYNEIEKIGRMPIDELKAVLAHPERFFSFKETGKIIWALVVDSRPVINELSRGLLRNIEEDMDAGAKFASRMEKEFKKEDDKLFSSKGYKKLLNSISRIKDELIQEKKASADLTRDIKRLRDKNDAQQELIHQFRKSEGGFIQEKCSWNKELEKKENQIRNFHFEITELKNKLSVEPKFRLKSEIHRLEKDNSKLSHLLTQQSRDDNEKINALERESLGLKQAIKDADEANLRLKSQLEAENLRCEKLMKEYDSVLVKKEPPLPPKEKGRRLGIFIDNQNVYYSSKRCFGKKLDYAKLLPVVVKGRHLVKAICYIVQQPESIQEGFINMLKNNGYTIRTRDLIRRADGSAKGNWDIGIAADVITMVEKNSLDYVALVTCDGDFVDLVKLLCAKGIKVEVVGFPLNMAMDLKKEADEFYFITEDLMIKD